MAIKLISLNIEGHHHVDRFLPFMRTEQPDVVCLQEVLGVDLPRICEVLQMQGKFVPLMRVDQENPYKITPLGEWGIALLTHLPHGPFLVERYRGSGEVLPQFIDYPNTPWRYLLTTTLTKNGETITVGTTHFTWSPKGEATDEQLRDFEKLMELVKPKGEMVLAGDVNAPRGRELFSKFSEYFTDNIPGSVRTTLDPVLHYAGPLSLVVDGLFTTTGLSARNVRVVAGVSDHQAIVGEVGKK